MPSLKNVSQYLKAELPKIIPISNIFKNLKYNKRLDINYY